MHQLDRKVLKLSVIVLFLSILLVYALFYQVKGKQIGNISNGDSVGDKTEIYVKSGENKIIMGSLDTIIKQDTLDYKNVNKNLTGKMFKLTEDNTLNSTTGDFDVNDTKNIKYLSGTKLFYGILESIEKLGVSYNYILQDAKGIYYVYVGEFKYDIVSITRKLGGNVFTINTEQEILKNKLFGDKISFINLPEYKNKTVLMLVYIDKDTWLLQVDYKLYHKSKAYLQKLFTD